MVEGAMRHGTDMEIAANYVDTHGQSFIGFGITRLLGFDLLPRIKRINRCRLDLADVKWDLGRFGKLHVRHGKGARGSGPRERMVPLINNAGATHGSPARGDPPCLR